MSIPLSELQYHKLCDLFIHDGIISLGFHAYRIFFRLKLYVTSPTRNELIQPYSRNPSFKTGSST